jgi:hypothetical protein
VLAGWLKYEQTFWAWEEVGRLVCSAPEQGWGVVLELVDTASPDALGAIGAGPLEDLIVTYGSASARFRVKLSIDSIGRQIRRC